MSNIENKIFDILYSDNLEDVLRNLNSEESVIILEHFKNDIHTILESKNIDVRLIITLFYKDIIKLPRITQLIILENICKKTYDNMLNLESKEVDTHVKIGFRYIVSYLDMQLDEVINLPYFLNSISLMGLLHIHTNNQSEEAILDNLIVQYCLNSGLSSHLLIYKPVFNNYNKNIKRIKSKFNGLPINITMNSVSLRFYVSQYHYGIPITLDNPIKEKEDVKFFEGYFLSDSELSYNVIEFDGTNVTFTLSYGDKVYRLSDKSPYDYLQMVYDHLDEDSKIRLVNDFNKKGLR